MKKVIITGATGMVGKGVLLECLDHPDISEVLAINRSSLEMQHPKLKEILLQDFTALESVKDQLVGCDGCFFCMGVSVVGLNEASYTQITYTITKIFADILHELNPNMVFNYVSGAGTDSSEQGRSMWVRVKGKTENYILNRGFGDAYAFRPGAIIPERGIKSKTGWYNAIYVIMRPFFPLLKKSKNITTTTKIGLAMIHTLSHSMALKHPENKDINLWATH
ncbi:NAD-dependent epimerase/dehydratase family protein [Aureisphaera galaxeae]|uniref:NAD-dependent epimerase/dehydratase family protein n=1 Tax=Aureisphaera galaxeae TaxID=1538023 RepID=UPI0023507E26|nr:NAD-dependent epimerase/dehydratase family protein [Aureisphaera galaxeae]MDC8004317.1 NAD-dependent epimerase/dehydratase family protein [Aureisphaera galaxeae]